MICLRTFFPVTLTTRRESGDDFARRGGGVGGWVRVRTKMMIYWQTYSKNMRQKSWKEGTGEGGCYHVNRGLRVRGCEE